MVLGVVGHVLADALLAAAAHADDGRDTREGRRHVAAQALQRVALDTQGQVGEALLEQAHGSRTLCKRTALTSRVIDAPAAPWHRPAHHERTRTRIPPAVG